MSQPTLVTAMLEINVDDELAKLSSMKGTTVVVIGDQCLLFDSGHERRVRVENGSIFIECSAAKAATFGLLPNS
jgi:hypothetical protein